MIKINISGPSLVPISRNCQRGKIIDLPFSIRYHAANSDQNKNCIYLFVYNSSRAKGHNRKECKAHNYDSDQWLYVSGSTQYYYAVQQMRFSTAVLNWECSAMAAAEAGRWFQSTLVLGMNHDIR